MTLTRRRTLCLAGATLAAVYPRALRAQSSASRVIASFSILADIAQELALARRYAANISAAFAQRWPGQRDEIARRNADYGARIAQLDAQVRGWLGAVPREQRRVITSHDAFGYVGAAYGVDFLAPQGWNTHSEPSAAAVARLIRQIKKNGVRAIFVENISDPRLVERIAREGGARIGGTLYSDALSKPGGPAAAYLQMFEHNARTFAAALQA